MTAAPRDITDNDLTALVAALASKFNIHDRDALRNSLRKAVDAYIAAVTYTTDAHKTADDWAGEDLDDLAKRLGAALELLRDERNFVPLALSLARGDDDPSGDPIITAVDRLDALTRETEAVRRAALDVQRRGQRPKGRPRKEEETPISRRLLEFVKELRHIWEQTTGKKFSWGWTPSDPKHGRPLASSAAMQFVERIVETIHPQMLGALCRITRLVAYGAAPPVGSGAHHIHVK